jgi:hypothetical protein
MTQRAALALGLAMLAGSVSAGGGWGAAGGVGDALQNIGREMESEAEQRDLLEQQHRQEMGRMREQFEQQRRAQEQANAAAERSRRQAAYEASRPAPDELRRRLQALDQVHPDWRVIQASPGYQNWLRNSPQIDRLFPTWDAATWIYVFSAYKRDAGLQRR